MSRSSKLITALLMIIFSLSLFTVTASAVGEEGEYSGGESEVIVPTEAPPVYTDPIVDPVVTDPIVEPVVTDPIVDPVYTEPVYTEPPVIYEPTYAEPDDNNNYGEYSDSQSSYISGEQSYADVEPASAVPLYDVDNNIDDTELSSNDWKDIAANLSNASDLSSDGDDFSFIQKNTNKGDNGHMILFLGILCLLLSASGIIYLIASAAVRRKKFTAGYASSANVRYRSDDDYDDGYSSAKKEQKRVDRSRKFDTADVNIPKSGSRYKSNGKRYK